MLSRPHGTIFVHIPKTAGQSVELAFLQDLGLTWETRSGLLLRPNEDRSAGPPRLAHLLASEYGPLGHLGTDRLEDFFRFSVVRDPYDRAVSAFNHFAPRDCRTVRDHVHAAGQDRMSQPWRRTCPQTRYLFDAEGQHLLVDEVLRFERLAQDWPGLPARVFGRPVPLPRRNVTNVRRLTRDRLDPADVDFITEHYAEDFRNFGYPVAGT